MTKTFTLAVAALTLTATMSHADAFTNSIVRDLQSKGFDRIEIENGSNRVKVEAIRGTRKTEVLYDRSTGRILSQEWERADADDIDEGVEIRSASGGFSLADLFSGDARANDDDDDDEDDDDDYDDRDDRDDRDDERDEDDREDDRGGRDDDDDDREDDDDDDDHDDNDDDDDSDDDDDDDDDDD